MTRLDRIILLTQTAALAVMPSWGKDASRVLKVLKAVDLATRLEEPQLPALLSEVEIAWQIVGGVVMDWPNAPWLEELTK